MSVAIPTSHGCATRGSSGCEGQITNVSGQCMLLHHIMSKRVYKRGRPGQGRAMNNGTSYAQWTAAETAAAKEAFSNLLMCMLQSLKGAR